MGQVGIPSLNRSGYSMFWNSVWEDKYNYYRNFSEDIFIRNFFFFLFDDYFSINILKFTGLRYLNNLNSRYSILNNYNINIKEDLTMSEIYSSLIRSSRKPSFLSKIWIMRYQTWLIVFFFIYSYEFRVLGYKNIEQEEKEHLDNYYYDEIWKNYLLVKNKSWSDYEFYKNSDIEKYNF